MRRAPANSGGDLREESPDSGRPPGLAAAVSLRLHYCLVPGCRRLARPEHPVVYYSQYQLLSALQLVQNSVLGSGAPRSTDCSL